jgi:fluoride exporter
MKALLVAFGGAVGCLARYGIGLLFGGHTFPWAILLANTVGCLLIGMIAAWLGNKGDASITELWRALLITGFLGGLTTFSTFAFDTAAALRSGQPAMAFGNIAANLILGLLAIWLGSWIGDSQIAR